MAGGSRRMLDDGHPAGADIDRHIRLHDDAITTMEREIAAQVDDMARILSGAAPALRAASDAVAGQPTISVGIGDSYLVGRLLCDLAPAEGCSRLRAIRPDELLDSEPEEGVVALCQSISGSTPVTVAAAAELASRGASVIAVT